MENGELVAGSQSQACSSGLCQDVSWGTHAQAWESVELGPDRRFYKGPSLFGIGEAFYFHCLFSM